MLFTLKMFGCVYYFFIFFSKEITIIFFRYISVVLLFLYKLHWIVELYRDETNLKNSKSNKLLMDSLTKIL